MSLELGQFKRFQTKIKESLRLPPNDLLSMLQKLPDNADVYWAVIQLMNQSSNKQQKQILATNLNFLVRRSFARMDKNAELWRLFYQHIAGRVEMRGERGGIGGDWSLSKITEPSFRKIVESFEKQFTPILEGIYFKLNLNHRILLQQMIRHGDIDQTDKLIFLQQTFEEYIQLGLQQIEQIIRIDGNQRLHQLKGRFMEYLCSVRDSLDLLNVQDTRKGGEERLRLKISADDQLFKLVHNCIFLNFINPDSSQNTNMQYLFSMASSSIQQQCLNNIKAIAIEILILMINNYSKKSSIREFDQSKVLGLMQNIVPCLVRELSQTTKPKLYLTCNEKLAIVMIKLIKSSIQFLFLHRYFSSNYHEIFWKIIYPLLITSDQQKRMYQDQPQGFIAQSDSINQKQEDDQGVIQSCKTYASFLLYQIIYHIDGALTNLTEEIFAILDHVLSGNSNQISRQLQEEFRVQRSLETCFTYLTILSQNLKMRKELLGRVREMFILYRNQFLSLRKIEKARMLIYLCYNFESIFMQLLNDQVQVKGFIHDIYQLASESIEQDELLTKCAIMFYQSNYNFEKSSQIVQNRLFELIQKTKYIQILQTIIKIIYHASKNINDFKIMEIIQKLLQRILKDNCIYIKALQNRDNTYSNICLIKCMEIIKAISVRYGKKDKSYITQEVMGKIWDIFGLMKYISQANYGEDLIKIFNSVLDAVKEIDSPHFYQFLGDFGQYHKKQQQIGILFSTYLTLLKKGQKYLKNTVQGNKFLSEIATNIIYVISLNGSNRGMVGIILLQYIFLKFPQINIDHEWVYQITNQYYKKRYQLNLSKQNISSILNLWIVGSIINEKIYRVEQQLDTFQFSYIFGYHTKIFCVGMKARIQKIIKQLNANQNMNVNVHKIQYLLKKSIQFLKIHENKTKKQNSTTEHKIQDFALISPNQKLRQIFVSLKKHLSSNIFQQILKSIQQQTSRQQLKKLLNRQSKDNRVIFKFI